MLYQRILLTYDIDEKLKLSKKLKAIINVKGNWENNIDYKEAYKIFACNGILFNHESPRRGETFVTQKIVQGLCRIKKNKQKTLYLGNLYSKRDWGHAKDYVRMQWMMLQQDSAEDFVIATGKQYSIKQFINMVAKELNMKISWKGKGINEKCFDQDGNCIVACDKEYFRPLEVDTLLGNSKKAKKELNWKPKIKIEEGINLMLKDIQYWQNAPVWTPSKIKKATKLWFKYLK